MNKLKTNKLKMNVFHVGDHTMTNEFYEEIKSYLSILFQSDIKLKIIDNSEKHLLPDYMVSACEPHDIQYNASIIHESIMKSKADVIVLDNDAMPIDQLSNWKFMTSQINNDRERAIYMWLAIYDHNDKHIVKPPLRIQRVIL